jgi:predicted transposase YbfD/YdcC
VEALELSGSVATIEVMGCQKAFAEKIITQKIDYILAVKDNQDHFLEEI